VAVIKESIHSKISNLHQNTEINFVCPVCKTKKGLQFPNSVINKSKQLTTISLPKGLVCEHHFQAFVDKNFIVRGYQKVDFEFKNHMNNTSEYNEEKFFEDLILEGNYVEYNPKNSNDEERNLKRSNSKSRSAEGNLYDKEVLKKIYEEFWDFIDKSNPDFKEFIEKDPRKRTPKIILS
jgi:hypothetical protein